MPRKQDLSKYIAMTDSEKRLQGKKHYEGKRLMPDVSQGGLTGVRFVSHNAQGSRTAFQPSPFNSGLESRLFGGVERQIKNTRGDPHRVGMNSQNLQKMVKSTVGNAYNLANAGNQRVGKKHRDNTMKGSLLGFHSATVPERFGQVPYSGRYF